MIHHIKSMADMDTKSKEAGDKILVIDFYATWCGPCKMIAPKIDEMQEEMKEKVLFVKVDVDECQDVAAEFNIEVMPTFILMHKGKLLDKMQGANADKLKALIERLVSDPVLGIGSTA